MKFFIIVHELLILWYVDYCPMQNNSIDLTFQFLTYQVLMCICIAFVNGKQVERQGVEMQVGNCLRQTKHFPLH